MGAVQKPVPALSQKQTPKKGNPCETLPLTVVMLSPLINITCVICSSFDIVFAINLL